MNARTSNATWPRPEPLPSEDVTVVIVEMVRKITTVAVIEGTTPDGVPVRCLLGAEATANVARRLRDGDHPSVIAPTWAVIDLPRGSRAEALAAAWDEPTFRESRSEAIRRGLARRRARLQGAAR